MAATQPTRARILDYLHTRPEGAAVTAIAEATGLSRSAVTKNLTAAETSGQAHRIAGERDGNRRPPDTWHPAEAAGPTEEAAPATAPEPAEDDQAVGTASPPKESASDPPPPATCLDAGEAEAEAAVPGSEQPAYASAPERDSDNNAGQASGASARAGEKTAAPDMPRSPGGQGEDPASSPDPGAGKETPAVAEGGDAPAPTGETGAEAAKGQDPPASANPPKVNRLSGTPRLRQGELRSLVVQELLEQPGIDFSPTELGHRLGRSIGAIQNALAGLVKTGEAELTRPAPRRYRSTGS